MTAPLSFETDRVRRHTPPNLLRAIDTTTRENIRHFGRKPLVGWCPPIPVFRRFGIRPQNELDQERHALKAVRGDFRPGGEVRSLDGKITAAIRAVGL